MSIPYTSGDFTTPRAGGESWIEYPFASEGDNTAKIYHLKCKVLESDYVPIDLDVTMATAGNADVIELPFTANATAYHVGDYNHQKTDGAMISFDRQFATIPATRTDQFKGSSTFPFPATMQAVYTPPDTAEAADDSDNLWEYIEIGSSNQSPAPLYVTSEYFLTSGTVPTIPSVLTITYEGVKVDYVSDSFSKTLTNSVALNGETFSAAISVSATSTTATAYAALVAAGTKQNIDVRIEQVRGNLYVMETHKMAAQ